MTEPSTQTLAQSLEGLLVEGKYQVLEKIGHGGMGVVYRAMHTLMDREVALKVLHSHLVDSEEFLKRFRHEAQVASKLRHPNAVMIYDYGTTGTLPYLVMEFVKGDTLKDLVSREGALNPKQLLEIMDQVFSAVTEAHRLGIVHRDLKPDNFILTKGDDGKYFARVLDFGIAKVLHPEGSKQQTMMTQAGAFFGTPRYASPEQALGKELDPRADIYALGVILYEGLTGEVPFDAPSMMELLLKHLNQPPPKVRERRPDLGISPQVESVVLKCLEKDRAKRFQSVTELAVGLREAVELGSVPAQTNSKLPYFIFGGVLAAAIGSGIYLLLGLRNNQKTIEVVPPTPAAVVTVVPIETTTPAPTQAPTPAATPTIEATTAPTASPTKANEHDLLVVTPTAGPTSVPEVPTPQPTSEVTAAPTALPVETATPAVVWTTEPTSMPTEIPTPLPTASPTTSVRPPGVEALDSVRAFKKGDELYRSRRYVEAIPYLEQTIAKDPGFKKGRLTLGICYARLKRMDEAFAQLKAAFDIDKTYPPTLFNLACYYAVTGQKESALRWLEKAIRHEPAVKRWAEGEPDFAPFRNDPRYKELVGD